MSKESESITRRDRINKKLRALNPPWQIIPYRDGLDTSQLGCLAVEEYPTASGPADYALFVQGQLLGFIEAKRVSVGPEGLLTQAKRYSKTTFQGVGNHWEKLLHRASRLPLAGVQESAADLIFEGS